MPVTSPETQHVPVLLEETLGFLRLSERRTIVDATLGFGGHSLAILSEIPEARVIAFDRDPSAIELAKPRLAEFRERITFVHSNFAGIKVELRKRSVHVVDAIIADLGLSSIQVDSETRGFSFRFDAPLDMRMDQTAGSETAAEILANRSEFEIADLIYRFGEERNSRRIARRIVAERESGRPVRTTKQLADLVSRSTRSLKRDAIHPATKTFQALRIAVNAELEILDVFVRDAIDILNVNGILSVISFHSLEDRIIKYELQRQSGKCLCPPRIPQCICGAKKKIEILTRKPIVPGAKEIEENPRSRSAKMRVVKKLEVE